MSVPVCGLLLVNDVTVPVVAYEAPGTAGIRACDFGVMRTLYIVALVPAVTPPFEVHVVNEMVLVPGFVTAVQRATLLLSVRSTCAMLLYAPAGERVTVTAVTVSLPTFVCRVKASRSVVAAPGAMVTLLGLVPSAMVVAAPRSVATHSIESICAEFLVEGLPPTAVITTSISTLVGSVITDASNVPVTVCPVVDVIDVAPAID